MIKKFHLLTKLRRSSEFITSILFRHIYKDRVALRTDGGFLSFSLFKFTYELGVPFPYIKALRSSPVFCYASDKTVTGLIVCLIANDTTAYKLGVRQ